MTKKWAFVSDFDGTISKKDFYWIVIESYYPEGEELYKQWKNGEMKDIEFLSTVFQATELSVEELNALIHKIPLDEGVFPFIDAVKQAGGDFIILSAGTDYYIHELIRYYDLPTIPVFSNRGSYENGGIQIYLDHSDPFYSERYGIDKKTVIEALQKDYEFVFYYGDSEPDSHPARSADRMFAKDKLVSILDEQNVGYEQAETFADVHERLKSEGWV
ncbi:MtnX-like HAD-IB family phosphatase [Salisediminibacterium halotolerans]|uniref:Haloacid Dehalogenase superfamily, subfamily IB, phosphoserine phosphatase-like/2,3-diketo-5-methylthio-1-phosphopentane phosphatase n=1 Tax=Salisediminibacterium halotolerans TaxID=517425 RepID=A0A1H9RT56_9BACI|nr:MtnX-like HAD-IB family phosphatase [Salisediminibacterium haloalkalitolerans]SER75323.1 Haloacid Dehalogenase superfamily, subfamily IB, phosphoserine phosphatase-like/2,3-diketo-5-methylthio-1-phosphopentane phosphatase [Salisediminibacterium haloalkalitolerans]